MLRPVAVFVVLTCAGGCGTVSNVAGSSGDGFRGGPNLVYGGTRADLYALAHPNVIYDLTDTTPPGSGTPPPGQTARVSKTAFTLAVAVVDLPLSLAGDTLTLWATVPQAARGKNDPTNSVEVDEGRATGAFIRGRGPTPPAGAQQPVSDPTPVVGPGGAASPDKAITGDVQEARTGPFSLGGGANSDAAQNKSDIAPNQVESR